MKQLNWKQGIVLFIVIICGLYSTLENTGSEPVTKSQTHQLNFRSEFKQLVENRISGEVVEVTAKVYKILTDDNVGNRHQRFLVNIQGVSVLIAHNIDLAPRVPVRESDEVIIKGEYEWNDKGGVIHWTHHDPKKWHEDGWIEHKGKKYK